MRAISSRLSRIANQGNVIARSPLLCTCRPLSRSLASASPSSSTTHDTIFAPATGRSKSAISILRISGPKALDVYRAVTRPPRSAKGKAKEIERPEARRAILRRIVHPRTEEPLDEGIVLFFPAHQALTGQSTLELHLHGSPALMSLLLELLPTLADGIRIAEPGEFTQLAFLAGKMDLTAVEGLRDLVDAETEQQRRLASRQAEGHMQRAYDTMRERIIEASALVEALIDFGEDQGIDEGVWLSAQEKVEALATMIESKLADERRGEIIRQGIQLAIVGAPNAGKSSLLNWLAQREAAIVTPLPGTTRDVVSLDLNYHGFPISVADTAGLRPLDTASDVVERIGIERAVQRAKDADVKIAMLSLPTLFAEPDGRPTFDRQTLELIDERTVVLVNKIDEAPVVGHRSLAALLETVADELRREGKLWIGSAVHPISVKTGAGLQEMSDELRAVLGERYEVTDDMDDTPLVTSARHRRHLEECLTSLHAFMELDADDIVMAAEELRYATLSLGRITGAVDVEEVLGEIFAGFCIGK